MARSSPATVAMSPSWYRFTLPIGAAATLLAAALLVRAGQLQPVVLGAVQGLAEFLPISSSAHLILVPWFLGWQGGPVDTLTFDVALHLGTLLAVLGCFWRDWLRLLAAIPVWLGSLPARLRGDAQGALPEDAALLERLVVATIPGGIAGVLLDSWAEAALRSPWLLAVTLPVMGLVLFLADRRRPQQTTLAAMTWRDTLLIGLAQALAIIPGVSRSGVTISMARARALDRSSAARFSFLLSAPITAAAVLFKANAILHVPRTALVLFVTGVVMSAAVGALAIGGLLAYLRRAGFAIFAVYRVALATLIVLWGLTAPHVATTPDAPQVAAAPIASPAATQQPLLAPAARTLGAAVQPRPAVFVILMENHNWADIKGNPAAPYINQTLLPQGSSAERYFNPSGVHPSEPNYLWLEAGTDFGIRDDRDPSRNHQATSAHLTTLLQRAGISWRAYQEDIDGTACPLQSRGFYAAKHNPMVFFDDVTNGNDPYAATCIAHIRPFSELGADLRAGTVPRYSFITPNVCHDMHGALGCGVTDPVAAGDAWLSQMVPGILASPAYQAGGVLIITWDEGEGGDGPIGLIVVSPLAKGGGYTNTIAYTHSSTLRTIEELLGVTPLLGDAATAPDLHDLFRSFPGAP